MTTTSTQCYRFLLVKYFGLDLIMQIGYTDGHIVFTLYACMYNIELIFNQFSLMILFSFIHLLCKVYILKATIHTHTHIGLDTVYS